MNPGNFFAELKRRNVIRMAGLYLVGAWLLTQVASTILPMFGAPEWLPRSIVVLLAIGFVPAVIFSWAFELTPDGLKRDAEMPPERSIASQTGRRMDRIIIAVLLLALGYFCFDKFVLGPRRDTALVAQNTAAHATLTPNDSNVTAKSIGVLPFVNISGNPENEYFSDGITEEILNALARTPGLRVAARTSAFFFKGKNEPVQKIGEALKVGVVLEGSVRRAGNQLRITAQLINVPDGYHLWSETFDRQAEDVFAIQSEVAQKVMEALKLKLLPESGPAVAGVGTNNLEAYDLFLRGRQFWNNRTGAEIRRAIGYFQQATERDPNFALAYAGLGSGYAILPGYAEVPVEEAVPKARAAARRALELDPKLAEAQAVLARCLMLEGDEAGAEKAIIEALALNPNYATAHQWYTNLLMGQGRFDQALVEIRLAQALDPLSPVIESTLGGALMANRRYEEALVAVDKALAFSADFAPAYLVRGWVKMRQKKFPEAIAAFEKNQALAGNSPRATSCLGFCYAVTGRTEDARQMLEQLKATAAKGVLANTEIACVYLGLGDKEEMFASLERAAQHRVEKLQYLQYDPVWDDVTADSRYAALLKKYGLNK